MKHEKKLKEYETVWTCDFCGEEFKTKKESDKHELTCKKNKNREILLRIKVPDKQTLFVLVSIFLGIYLFTFAIANSYAKTNGLGKKYLTNPLNWFSEEIKNETTPTLTPTPETTPTSTPSPKPKTQTNNTNTNQGNQIECIGPDGKHFNTTLDECKKLAEKWGKTVDYMVNCTYPTECGGGVHRIPKSECDKPCTATQKNNNSSNNTQGKVAVYFTALNYTWYCPAQNVDAVKAIDATMKNQQMDLAKKFNECADLFRSTDPCWKSCKDNYTTGDEYSICINKCSSPNAQCDYVYAEQKSQLAQLNILCPE